MEQWQNSYDKFCPTYVWKCHHVLIWFLNENSTFNQFWRKKPLVQYKPNAWVLECSSSHSGNSPIATFFFFTSLSNSLNFLNSKWQNRSECIRFNFSKGDARDQEEECCKWADTLTKISQEMECGNFKTENWNVCLFLYLVVPRSGSWF